MSHRIIGAAGLAYAWPHHAANMSKMFLLDMDIPAAPHRLREIAGISQRTLVNCEPNAQYSCRGCDNHGTLPPSYGAAGAAEKIVSSLLVP